MTSYIVKSILCSGILLLFYHLFLEREKLHKFNRFYLLGSILFAVLIPLVTIELTSEPGAAPEPIYLPVQQFTPETTVNTMQLIDEPDALIPPQLPLYIYCLVAGLLLLRFLNNLRSVITTLVQNKTIPYQGARLVLVPGSTVTYTFLYHIFINANDFDRNLIEKEILTHELAHVKQHHSLDILFLELFQIVFWFNPLVIFYKKAIQLNHEFLADEAVLEKYHDQGSYKLLLLDKVLSARPMNLTSSFNYSITKKRLAMMTKTTNPLLRISKQCVAITLTLGLAMLFCEKIYSQEKADTEVKTATPIEKPKKNHMEAPSEKTNRPKAIYEQPSGSGLSAAESQEFMDTIEKHTTYTTTKKGLKIPIIRMSPALENRLYELYIRMTKDQQIRHFDEGLVVFKMDIPVKKAPTPEMFENWKKPTTFGIWLNNKHVPNTELDKYQYGDIAEYSLSKLYGAALKGRIYKYQLDLLTNDYFDKTFEGRMADRVLISRAVKRKATAGD